MKKILIKIIPYPILLKIKYLNQFIISYLFLGNKYYCPICKTKFRKMLNCGEKAEILKELKVIGSGVRSNCLCPRCLSNDRERLVFQYLKDKTTLFTEKNTLLHIAPRQSFNNVFKNYKNIKYFPGDKFEKGYHYSKDVIELDITKLNFEDNFFDVIICNHVLEHIPDDIKALNELYRVLKPNGYAILQVPISLKLEKTIEIEANTEEDRIKFFGQSDHYRIYAKDYFKRLEDCNFKVKLYNPNDNDWNLNINKYGLNKLEYVIVAYKKYE